MSNAIVESMAAGLPVVATRVGSNGELVEEGPGPETTGHLVPAYRPSLLAQALIGLLKDPERARVFGAAGRRRVEARMTSAALSARMGELYERVLAGPRRAGVGGAAEGTRLAGAPTSAGAGAPAGA
jgi:glycosyltransferase involved in cell wall biosynthesis